MDSESGCGASWSTRFARDMAAGVWIARRRCTWRSGDCKEAVDDGPPGVVLESCAVPIDGGCDGEYLPRQEPRRSLTTIKTGTFPGCHGCPIRIGHCSDSLVGIAGVWRGAGSDANGGPHPGQVARAGGPGVRIDPAVEKYRVFRASVHEVRLQADAVRAESAWSCGTVARARRSGGRGQPHWVVLSRCSGSGTARPRAQRRFERGSRCRRRPGSP